MSTPGAATSGFSRSEIVVGPTEENSACVPRVVAPLISTAPTADRALGVRRRRDRAGSQVVEVVSGGDDRDDSRTSSGVEGEGDDVAARLDLRLSDREVEHVHAVSHRGLDGSHDLGGVPVGAQPRVRAHERLVVADERAWRDARHRAPRGLRASVPGRDPGDVGAVRGVVAVESERCILVARPGRRKCARDDHLRVREALLALRKPGRHRVAGRIEEHVVVIHAGVDHADLDALACRLETCAPERRCADLLGAPVKLWDVLRGGEYVAYSGNVAEQRHLCARENDGEAVRDDAIAPANPRVRKRLARARSEMCAARPQSALRCQEHARAGERPARPRPPTGPPYPRSGRPCNSLLQGLSPAGARCRRERGRRERGRERGRVGSSRDETSRS